MSEQLQALIAAAGSAANARRWHDAERLWSQVRALDPGNVQALFSLGVHAHQRGDARGALELLEAARAAAPGDPMLALTLAVVHRDLGDTAQEWAAIHAALALDARLVYSDYQHNEFEGGQRGTTFTSEGFEFRSELTHQDAGPAVSRTIQSR